MTSTHSSGQRRRWFRPRFSLLSLLIFTTLVGIAIPAWYRRPYQEEIIRYRLDAAGKPIPSRPEARTIATYQRQWGGGRVKHGLETEFDPRNATIRSTRTYANGQLHGPYREWSGDSIVVEGEYIAGRQAGTWYYYEPRRAYRVENWKDGVLDGEQQKLSTSHINEPPFRTTYKNGRLKTMLNQPVTMPVMDKIKIHTANAARVRRALAQPAQSEFVETPLADVLHYFSDVHNVPINLAPAAEEQLYTVTNSSGTGSDLFSALAMMLAPNGLTCDFRFGGIWVTTLHDAATWRDTTGVYELEPPPESPIAGAWHQPVDVNASEEPPAAVIASLAESIGIEIDASAIASDSGLPRVNYQARGIELRDALGGLLDKAGCRCMLQGDRLVVLPCQK